MHVEAARRAAPRPALDADGAWALVRAMRRHVVRHGPLQAHVGLAMGRDGELEVGAPDDGAIVLRPETASGWAPQNSTVTADATHLLELYVPLVSGPHGANLVVGHLAQSLDGRVATTGGASQFISGEPDLDHTHRLRALFDAVIVGACTVELDDPRLTTRRVEGPSPTRVVLDGRARLQTDRKLFVDGAAPTLLVRGRGANAPVPGTNTELVEVDLIDGWMPTAAVVEALAERGLCRLFVEGGGVTVSRFMRARLMHRLHLTVAPVLFGSGRPAIALPEIDSLDDAIPVQCRHIPMGPDMLFDCPLPR